MLARVRLSMALFALALFMVPSVWAQDDGLYVPEEQPGAVLQDGQPGPAAPSGDSSTTADPTPAPLTVAMAAGQDGASQQPGASAPASGASSSSGFLSGLSDFAAGVRTRLAGNPVTLTDDQRAALTGMRPPLIQLAGPDGLFNRNDVPDVLAALQPDLANAVDQEIWRRAGEVIDRGRFPRVRQVFVDRHVNRNYDNYFSQGMDQANGMVTSGLEEFFNGVGVDGQSGPTQAGPRQLTLADMEAFRQGAEALRAIDQQRGNPPLRVTFPNGFGVADLDAILRNPNALPPNGRIGRR